MALLLIRDADSPAPDISLAGPEQGVIEEARRRQRKRRVRALAGALVVAVVVGGFVISDGGRGSDPQARGDGSGAPATGTHRPAPVAPGFSVRLTPALDGGQYGWCVVAGERGKSAGGGCSATPVASVPLAFDMSSGNARSESIYFLTTPPVAAIVLNRRYRARTFSMPGLPYGLRAARVMVRTRGSGHLVRLGQPALKVLPLAAGGRPIAAGSIEQPSFSTRAWQAPRPQPSGPCQLRASGLPGLSPRWGHVASALRGFPAPIVGRAFFSCIDTDYYLHGSSMDVAILLDAAHPGASPAAIPGLEAVSAAPGFFDGPGGFHGDLTALRDGSAWLVVEGGGDVAQRVRVLRHIHATIAL